MSLTVGTEVLVLPLNRKGRIVAVGGKGRYRVALGAVTSWHAESELSEVAGGRRRAKAQAAPQPIRGAVQSERQPEAAGLRTLDLHGLTVEEALAKLGSTLDQAIRAGLDGVEIIHGISGGRLRGAVHKYLRDVPSVVRFGLDPRNPGVTKVWF